MPRPFLPCLVAVLTFTSLVWSANAPAPSLPPSIRATMDQEYPGWKLAPVNADVQKTFNLHPSGHPPSLVSADFNLDGQRDYAVQIALTQPEHEEQIIIVYLQVASGEYQEIIVQSQGIDPGVYLWTGKKDVPESGPDGQERLVKKDVLMVLGSAIGDTTYAFQNGEFHELKTDSQPPDSPDTDAQH